MVRYSSFLAALLLVAKVGAFVARAPATANNARIGIVAVLNQSGSNFNENGNNNERGGGILGGFLQDIKDMGASLDDVVDDFVNKRMGAGEQWYGKRKYKPSGSVEGDYNGMGLTDKLRIDIARVQKEEFQAKRERERRAREEDQTRRG